MADSAYHNENFILKSRGIVARNVSDACEPGQLLNENSCEELAENSIGTRLGSQVLNAVAGSGVINLLPGLVHSLAKLNGLNGAAYRYAGVGNSVYRRTGLTKGPYTKLTSGLLSGQPWQGQSSCPSVISGTPTMFIADANGMFKDTGTQAALQQMGIFQPLCPVRAQAQAPFIEILDFFQPGTYNISGTTSFLPTSGGVSYQAMSTTITAAITEVGLQEVPVANPRLVGRFQVLSLDHGTNSEDVLVLDVTSTGIIANFTKTHALGGSAIVEEYGWSANVAASAVATIGHTFNGFPFSMWPTTLDQEDYIGAYLFVSDPTQVQSITIKFDCGDGSFASDYFYKVIAQGPLQSLLTAATSSSSSSTSTTTALTNAYLEESMGLYDDNSRISSMGSIAQLQTGSNNWTPLLLQLSDFAASGRADFNDPVFNWAAVNGYQITITMNDTSSATIELASLVAFGGSGADSFAGVGYDYLFTLYNNVDGTESNPSMEMSNINPPNQTMRVYPRRQPVNLTLSYPLVNTQATIDPQITSLRIYRRGGTMGDNFRRIDEVLITGSPQTYVDKFTDLSIQQSDMVSFVNDVPVTSSLQIPVNTTLANAINPGVGGSIVTVTPASMANISLRQQVSIGVVGDAANTFETVVVMAVYANFFQAFVQNAHALGEPVTATASYGQPVTIMAQAFNQFWFAGDNNNPNYLYWSASNNPQAVSSAAYVQVSTPDDTITLIAGYKGNLYVSTVKGGWFSVAPGSNGSGSPTIYPTAAKHGCVAPLGWVATEEAIFYQAIDGIRLFAGGASDYLTQGLEFLFQGVGSSPITQADPTQLSLTRAAYWNNMIYFSYVGIDGSRHRLCLHTTYKRWRNDDVDAQSMLLEKDTNQLLYGDSLGMIHLDRQNQFYDEGASGTALVQIPIPMNLQCPYTDFGMPAVKKNLQELTLDINTNGQTLAVSLWFEDGIVGQLLGSVNTTVRSKVNFSLNNGEGFEYYKVSVQIVGNVKAAASIYQIGLKALALAKTRTVMDTYHLRLGTDESKVCKQVYIEYTATEPITFEVFYEASDVAGFTFTLPTNNGVRNALRVRLPAISARLIRFIGSSVADFQIWEVSRIEYKVLCSGKGYQVEPFIPNG